MNNKTDKAPALRCEAMVRLCVMPKGIALAFIDPRGGPYKMVTRGGMQDGWSTLYKGRKRIWACNSIFGKVHFYDVKPNVVHEPRAGESRSVPSAE